MTVSSSITADGLFAMSKNVFDAMRGLDTNNPHERELRNALYAAHDIIHDYGRAAYMADAVANEEEAAE